MQRPGGQKSTMHMGSDVQRSSADAGGTPPSLHPVPLHAGHQPQRSACDLCKLLPHPQAISKAVQVQAGVHRPRRAASMCPAVNTLSTQSGSFAQGQPISRTMRAPSAGTLCADSGSPGEHGLLLQAQELAELEEDVPQHEDIDLERV